MITAKYLTAIAAAGMMALTCFVDAASAAVAENQCVVNWTAGPNTKTATLDLTQTGAALPSLVACLDGNDEGNGGVGELFGLTLGASLGGGPGDGNITDLMLVGQNWSFSNPNGYENLYIGIKQSQATAVWELDSSALLAGTWMTTGPDNANNAYSHFNVWYDDTPPPAVPLPAAGWMLIAGLGGLGSMRRFRKS